MKALSPAKVKEVRIDEDTGTAEVIVPDYQLSLAIGKEGQNARLAARLTGWRVDIKSETQLAEEEAYANQDWAEGEWVVDPETGEQVWQPADGGEALSAEEWAQQAAEEAAAEADGRGRRAAPTSATGASRADAADRCHEPPMRRWRRNRGRAPRPSATDRRGPTRPRKARRQPDSVTGTRPPVGGSTPGLRAQPGSVVRDAASGPPRPMAWPLGDRRAAVRMPAGRCTGRCSQDD